MTMNEPLDSATNKGLTTRDYWADVWRGTKLPIVRAPEADSELVFKEFLPKSNGLRLIEIGCAPGGWMSYFHSQFGYSVDGIEYVPDAVELTRANMKIQNIDAQVWCDDFFSIDTSQFEYDIVYSKGFIEHFQEYPEVCERLAEIGRIVVTIIPNLYGVNGWISKTARPHVYEKHVPINLQQLRNAHEAIGLKTKFCNYVGGMQFLRFAERNRHFADRPKLAKCLNAPVRTFNRLSRIANRRLAFRPKACWCCPTLLYIGER